jgi:hypothetical protein
MKIAFNSTAFRKDMRNIVDYSIGFVDGIHAGKKRFLDVLGLQTINLLKEYIDSNARANPAMLHHVYEWHQTGSPAARLFDIKYITNPTGISFTSSFKQSTSIKDGSRVPFYDKARIIENGIAVTIRPVKAEVLAFDINGEEIFTKNPVEVLNPGGTAAQRGFEKVFDSFFNRFFSQAFLRISGIAQYLERPTIYKKNLSAGKKMGRSKGYETGYRWIASAGVGR